jgi:hypothetical protein
MNTLFEILTFPFRLIGKVIDVAGRLVVLIVGFLFMVLGIGALGPLGPTIGIPLFIVGLLLTLRALS